jgi:hypothetical protein
MVARTGVNERECDVSNAHRVDVHELTLARMKMCECELSACERAGEYREFGNGLSVQM